MTVDVAAAEAVVRHAALHLVCRYPGPDGDDPVEPVAERVWAARADALEAAAVATRRAYLAAPGLAVTSHVGPGELAEALVEESRTAALVAVDGRPGPVDGTAGRSPAARVVAHSHSAVIVVPPRARGAFDGPVVVGIDACAGEQGPIDFAFDEAALRGAPLRAVYVWSGVPATGLGTVDPFGYDLREARATAARLLAEALAGWSDKYPQVPVEREPRYHLNVEQALVDASADAALLVVCDRRLPASSPLLPGPVTRRLIHEAACPVAVVTRPSRRAAGT